MTLGKRIWCLMVCGPVAWACIAQGAERIDFATQIAPILARSCVGCHHGSDPAGALDLAQREKALTGGDSGEAAIVPGQPSASQMLARVKAGEMPPQGKGQKLSAAEIELVEAWIRGGADWPVGRVIDPVEFSTELRAGRDWWSLKRPVLPPVPAVQRADRVRTPIDAFVVRQLEERGLTPSDDADRATLIRRASFDLLGLPPAPEEIEAFVADASPDAYERLVDRMLASARYGERWARHWMDVVRFGESNGYETNTERPNAWPYRDWLIAALNQDMPYPRFILEQLAGDQLGADAATGYLVAGAHDVVASPDVELTAQQRLNDLDDMVSTTATTFLGLTIGCAKCHDHKFDPLSQRDYYAMQAFFSGVRHGERELETPDAPRRREQAEQLRQQIAALEREAQQLAMRHAPLARLGQVSAEDTRAAVSPLVNVDRFAPVRARFVRFTVRATNTLEPCLDELEVFTADEPSRNVALASAGARPSASSVYAGGSTNLHKLAHICDGLYGNSKSWISAETGGGWVQVELAEPATIDRVVWARDREGAFRDRLPIRYQIEVSESGDGWQVVATSDDRKAFDTAPPKGERLSTTGLSADVAARVTEYRRQIESLQQRLAVLAPQKAYVGTFGDPDQIHLLYRGEPLQKRDVIAPGTIRSVGPALDLDQRSGDAQRRLALARWLGSRENPLSARVMVNRVWHYHFGQGLVKSPSDFGFHGGRPSHPQLLDWLTVRFMDDGWSLKSLHRLIMLSTVYRQQSRYRPEAAAQDADCRLLWRFAPRRLEAEAIRDSMLCASGALDLRMGGKGYEVFEPNTNYVKVYTPKQKFTPAEWRRMVYQNKPRMRQDSTFGDFDCPDSSQTMPRRNISTTALQSLNLLNGPLVVEQSSVLAERLMREAPGDVPAQVRRAFWLTFGRAPDDDELAAAGELVAREGLAVFCRALFNANEFIYLN